MFDFEKIVEALGDHRIEQDRLSQILPFDGDDADLAGPPRTNGVSFSTFDPSVADRARSNSRRIESVHMNEPAGGLRPPHTVESGADPRREERLPIGNVRDQRLQVRDLSRFGVDPGNLEEGRLRMAQIETIAMPFEVLVGIDSELLRIRPVGPPVVQVFRATGGSVCYGQQKP